MWTEAGLARCAAKEVEDPVTMGPVKIKKKKEGTDIYDCLAEFCKSEKLRKTEAWYCRVCKKHQEANKKFDLWKLPPVIILHMKRFSFNNYRRNKIDSFVDFPLEDLDLSEYVKNPEEGKNAQYDLYAVSNHFGGTGGGHYTAYARNLVDGNWYNLDDSSTRRVDASDVKTKAAYVLFYVKKGFTGPQ
jgi:ubiquitin carboxyl-terminal hydrolase 4/11/15